MVPPQLNSLGGLLIQVWYYPSNIHCQGTDWTMPCAVTLRSATVGGGRYSVTQRLILASDPRKSHDIPTKTPGKPMRSPWKPQGNSRKTYESPMKSPENWNVHSKSNIVTFISSFCELLLCPAFTYNNIDPGTSLGVRRQIVYSFILKVFEQVSGWNRSSRGWSCIAHTANHYCGLLKFHLMVRCLKPNQCELGNHPLHLRMSQNGAYTRLWQFQEKNMEK